MKEIRIESNFDSELNEIACCVSKSRKLVLITGAGISCNAGIPDFRSTQGFYAMAENQFNDIKLRGKDFFDTIIFNSPRTTQAFFTFIANMRSCILQAHPTATHNFVRQLKEKGKLLRCYTQNIDGLEGLIGLSVGTSRDNDVVQLHGDIHKLKCMSCCEQTDWTPDHLDKILNYELPLCTSCAVRASEREQAGKRNLGVGVLRPDIVLYGEDHPKGTEIGICAAADMKARPDCLVIAGTSLKVKGIRQLVRAAAKQVHDRDGKVFQNNNDSVSTSMWDDIIDFHVAGDCDTWVTDVLHRKPNLLKPSLSRSSSAASATSLNSEPVSSQPARTQFSDSAIVPPRTPKRATIKLDSSQHLSPGPLPFALPSPILSHTCPPLAPHMEHPFASLRRSPRSPKRTQWYSDSSPIDSVKRSLAFKSSAVYATPLRSTTTRVQSPSSLSSRSAGRIRKTPKTAPGNLQSRLHLAAYFSQTPLPIRA